MITRALAKCLSVVLTYVNEWLMNVPLLVLLPCLSLLLIKTTPERKGIKPCF